MLQLALASRNRHKLTELRQLIIPQAELVAVSELAPNLDLPETGSSFQENAYIKAKLTADATGLISLADDSGLEVDALNGEPGIYSARYAGAGADDAANNRLLLKRLESVPPAQRSARFRCVIAVVLPSGQTYFAEGALEGVIGFEPKGGHGFGYDPLFIVPEYGRTLAELGQEVKNRLSHRYQAVKEANKILLNLLSPGCQSDIIKK